MSTTENPSNTVDAVERAPAAATAMNSHLPLSSLHNPTWEFLHTNYTKSELQKHCSHLGLRGIWTTKEKLIDKLMTHYSNINNSPSTSNATHGGDGEYTLAELRERFETFIYHYAILKHFLYG